jgi:hypothetical protein
MAGCALRNPCLDAAIAELEAVGIRSYQLAHGGKHLQLRWSVNGHPLRMLTIAGTPGDWRAANNTRRDIRALLRLDGIIEPPRSNDTTPGARPANWRWQIEALRRKLNRINIPDELAAERGAIVAGLRRLAEGSEP